MQTTTAVLMLLLAAAAVCDIRERRIPNWLNLAILVGGLLAALSSPPTINSLFRSLFGVGVGFAVWIPFYLFRLVGAGDVKLMAASGAWLGAAGVLSASLWAGMAGGVLGAFWILRRQGAQAAMLAIVHALRTPRLLQMRPMDRRERVPYAVAIAVGVLISWFDLSSAFSALRAI